MSEALVLNLAQNAAMMILIIAGPILLASLVIGSLISLIQAATQINEATLTFIPKMIVTGLLLLLLGSWMLQKLILFTINLFTLLPNMVK
jgi:flagellar biosynthesis protein FliQ